MSKNNLSIGIVGLPNVGKSTLFNALLQKQSALAANYPFATVEPNVGVVEVPDDRVKFLSNFAKKDFGKEPESVVSAVVKFVDIAGLVKGASQGEGLGNKFLSHIRQVDAILHVIRLFEDPNVARAGSTDPENDKNIVNTELILSDIDTIEKRLNKEERLVFNDAEIRKKVAIYKKLLDHLNLGMQVRHLELEEKEKEVVKELQLLTHKPVLYVFNVSENSFLEALNHKLSTEAAYICAKMESDLSELPKKDQIDYMRSIGISEPGLNIVIKKSYELLGLQSFFTYNAKEVHAWTIEQGTVAPQAAGKVHTDFERGFISALVISFDDLARVGGWKNARKEGLIRTEGRSYVMQEGDVVEFRFSV